MARAGRLTGREDPHERVAATLATTVLALERGATVFRVHDVAPTADALIVLTNGGKLSKALGVHGLTAALLAAAGLVLALA